jgi:osmoprotectant transport system substrate-binding protein
MKSSIRTGVLLASVAVFVFLFAATPAALAGGKIVVGGKNFTEQYFLPNMAALLLQKAGFDTEIRTGMDSAGARSALEAGKIDMYYEYPGTAYTVFYKESDRKVLGDGQKVHQWIKKYDARKGFVWLPPALVNNTFTLMMRKEQADKLGISAISGLCDHVRSHPGELVFGVSTEIWERTDGVKPLLKTLDTHVYLTFQNMYLAEEFKPMVKPDDFRIPYEKVRKMESVSLYKALQDKKVDVSIGFATDGAIEPAGFVALKDDRSYFPAYNPAPVIREQIVKTNPNIETILKPLAEKLTTEEMQRLNSSADIQKKDVSAAARSWLQEKGLL